MKQSKQNQSTKEVRIKDNLTPGIEAHIKTFSSIIVEKIMEDIKNGTFDYKMK